MAICLQTKAIPGHRIQYDHLNRIRSGKKRHPSSLKKEKGGKENGLLKLTKNPVPAPDAPEEGKDYFDDEGNEKLKMVIMTRMMLMMILMMSLRRLLFL